MAKYLRSTDGNNADDGSTWALAKANLLNSVLVAGETVYVSQAHNEVTAARIDVTFAGTPANPNYVLCGSDSASPPTSDAVTAVVSTTGQASLNLFGSAYVRGITFICGNGPNYSQLSINGEAVGNIQTYEKCTFRQNDSHPSSGVSIGGYGSTEGYLTTLIDCQLKVSSASCVISMTGDVRIRGGGFEAATTSQTTVFLLGGTGVFGLVDIDGFDFSTLSSAMVLFTDTVRAGKVVLKNCKMPSGWSQNNLVSSVGAYPNSRYEMYNCDAGDTQYKFRIKDFAGLISDETTIIKTGGANNGAVGFSAKMVTGANAKEGNGGLTLFPLTKKVESVGSALTATVDIIHDSATALNNADIWMELTYLGTSSSSKSTITHNRRTSPLATAADHATSSATWATTGLTTPNKQQLQITFTPQEAGLVSATVHLAKSSSTVFVDTKLTVA